MKEMTKEELEELLDVQIYDLEVHKDIEYDYLHCKCFDFQVTYHQGTKENIEYTFYCRDLIDYDLKKRLSTQGFYLYLQTIDCNGYKYLLNYSEFDNKPIVEAYRMEY